MPSHSESSAFPRCLSSFPSNRVIGGWIFEALLRLTFWWFTKEVIHIRVKAVVEKPDWEISFVFGGLCSSHFRLHSFFGLHAETCLEQQTARFMGIIESGVQCEKSKRREETRVFMGHAFSVVILSSLPPHTPCPLSGLASLGGCVSLLPHHTRQALSTLMTMMMERFFPSSSFSLMYSPLLTRQRHLSAVS